jgi:hypothetical protein
MASTIIIDIDLQKIKKEKIKDDRWLKVAFTVNDETDPYGNNVWAYHQQTKEERDAKTKRDSLGNGKVVWENGVITKAEWVERQVNNSQQNAEREETDLF